MALSASTLLGMVRGMVTNVEPQANASERVEGPNKDLKHMTPDKIKLFRQLLFWLVDVFAGC